MRSIKLSLRHAEAIRRVLSVEHAASALGSEEERAFAAICREVDAVLARPKSSLVKKTERRRREKGKETKSIRAEVFERARGLCELRCGAAATDLHHAFGRREQQKVETCLALCRWCHRMLTEHTNGAASSWRSVAEAFRMTGLDASAGRAYAIARKHETKEALAS